ncbi:MAG: DUF5615 family PIN-like protein [Candidatus Odinarchaeota archaeon]
MKFLLDENVPRSLKNYLLKQQYTAVTIQELNKRGISNGEVAELAIDQDYVIITFDEDFTVLKEELRKKARIIYIKMHPRDPRKAKELLEKHLQESLKKLKTQNTVLITEKGVE